MKINYPVTSSSITKKGGRSSNQDCVLISHHESGGYFTLADGLGGHSGGEEASQCAIDITSKLTKNNKQLSKQDLESNIQEAHNQIKQKQAESDEQKNMATTLVILNIIDNKAIWGHIGDSRLYQFYQNKIIHQTKDHSMPQLLVSTEDITEDEMRNHPDRNQLLRALGSHHETISATILSSPIDLKDGDVFLLCTDGFWEWILEIEMLNCLSQSTSPQSWLDKMEAVILKNCPNDADNYSAIAIWVGDVIGNLNKEKSKTLRKLFTEKLLGFL